MGKLTVVFVHGYSVTNLDTYGEMPLRIKNEAQKRGMEAHIEDVYLGRYISFNDEVRLNDVSKAMETAVQQQVLPKLGAGNKFVCVTHSTGGPVVRNWWQNHYSSKTNCPMSHLIMLAPANHGSALAQLGKSKLSRLKSWFDGVEPGQGVLDWLELGSSEAWELNKLWINTNRQQFLTNGYFPFVIAGQSIDRKLYDHLNTYTGEIGSDGVVRVTTTNLNSVYIKLTQPLPAPKAGKITTPNNFEETEFTEAPAVPMRVVRGKSHSGDKMGIQKSVKESLDDHNSDETVNAIFDCINVKTIAAYDALCIAFAQQTAAAQKDMLIEKDRVLGMNKYYIHDRYCMIIFRVRDSEGYPVTNFDLLLTAGDKDDPNHLPTGFFADRQCNRVNKSTITYFLNYDVMTGCDEVKDGNNSLRPKLFGIDKLGMVIYPRPDEGFIRYAPCRITASKDLFDKVLKPNSTTMIDICLKRLVSTEVFRFETLEEGEKVVGNFKNTQPGKDFI